MERIVNHFVYKRILENNMPNPTIPAWVNETYSQCYEDVIIESLLRARSILHGLDLSNLTYIEIGANHPVCTNSTYYLNEKYGMTGTLVEANPELAANLQKFRPMDTVIQAAVYDQDVKEIDFYISNENEISSVRQDFVNDWKQGQVGLKKKITVPTVRINDILSTVDEVIALLSIDVEGFDINILRDTDFDIYRPILVQVEPSDSYIANSSKDIIELMCLRDYKLVAATDVNLIFEDTLN